MTIEKTENNGVLSLKPVGKLDSNTSLEFENSIAENFTESFSKLIIDMEAVPFISSRGLRTLIATERSLNGRKLELKKPQETVIEVLRISGLLNNFTITN